MHKTLSICLAVFFPRTDTRYIMLFAVKSYINTHTLLLSSLSKTRNQASLSLLICCRISLHPARTFTLCNTYISSYRYIMSITLLYCRLSLLYSRFRAVGFHVVISASARLPYQLRCKDNTFVIY